MDNKESQINKLMDNISKNEKLKEEMVLIANDQCASEGITDLEERNNLFFLIGTTLAFLSYAKLITLTDPTDYKSLTKDEEELKLKSQKISQNKNLFEMITKIIDNEIGEVNSKVRIHLFLMTALSILYGRGMIIINNNNK